MEDEDDLDLDALIAGHDSHFREDDIRSQLSYGEDDPVAITLTGDDPLQEGTQRNPEEQFYHDPSTAWAISKGYFIEIYHLLSTQSIFFKAFLTDFSDNFSANYNKEQVFGRSDPIQTYQNTERTINLAWDLVSSNLKEAKQNMIKANNLISMMYPSYGGAGDSATNIKSGPLFKIKMGNLICRPGLGEDGGTSPAQFDGLACTISGFQYSPSIDDGFFDPVPGIFYPQTINIDIELSVLHEQVLGFNSDQEAKSLMGFSQGSNDSRPAFPYGGAIQGGTPTSANNSTVRSGLPSELIEFLADLDKGDPPPINVDVNGERIANVYGADSAGYGEVNIGIQPGIGSFLELQKDLMNARLRVRANEILSPQDRTLLRNIDRFLFEDVTALW